VETYAEAVGLKLPVSWRVSERFVYLTSDEHGTLEEWMNSIDGLLADPRCQPGLAYSTTGDGWSAALLARK
jgi:hypothetical protein